MKRIALILILMLLVSTMAMNLALAESYRLAPGDVLDISVWGYEDLQIKEIFVRPDGKIQFPLAGEVQAAGRTAAECKQEITDSLRDYVNDPQVTLNVVKYHTTRIYVLGEVAKPGMYEIEKQHNLLDAIGIAGGYTKEAAKKNIFVVRKDQKGEPLKANLLQLLKKGDMSQNYSLSDGDTVFLTSNGRINFATDILPWISATYQVKRMNNDD